MARITSELTTNGPMPIMSIMLSATASLRPRAALKSGIVVSNAVSAVGVLWRLHQSAENSKWPASVLSPFLSARSQV